MKINLKLKDFSSCDLFYSSSLRKLRPLRCLQKVASSKYTKLLNGVNGGNVVLERWNLAALSSFYFLTTSDFLGIGGVN